MPASTPRERVVSTVVRSLAPYIGANMAGSAVRMQLEKLGLGGATLLADEQIEALLKELSPALHVFIGRPTTLDALTRVREALNLGSQSKS